jgi:hypothetical protein
VVALKDNQLFLLLLVAETITEECSSAPFASRSGISSTSSQVQGVESTELFAISKIQISDANARFSEEA